MLPVRFLNVRLEASLVNAGSGNLTDFPGLWFKSLVILSSGPYSKRQEDTLNMGYCGDFSKVHIKTSHLQFAQLQEKGHFYFSMIPCHKDGRKIENISLVIRSQTLEESRI